MKTLDEVIEKIEKMWVFPSSDEAAEYCDFMEVKADALHYLKAFRDAKDTLEREKDRYAEAVKNCERAENIYKQKQKAAEDVLWKISSEMNPALTWDNLCLMVGKPVWIEYDNHLEGRKRTKFKDWEIIDCIVDDMCIVKGDFDYHKSELGDTWQAYRKERG